MKTAPYKKGRAAEGTCADRQPQEEMNWTQSHRRQVFCRQGRPPKLPRRQSRPVGAAAEPMRPPPIRRGIRELLLGRRSDPRIRYFRPEGSAPNLRCDTRGLLVRKD